MEKGKTFYIDSAYIDFAITVAAGDKNYVNIGLSGCAKRWVRDNAPKNYQYKEEHKIDLLPDAKITHEDASNNTVSIKDLDKKLNLALSDMEGLASAINEKLQLVRSYRKQS